MGFFDFFSGKKKLVEKQKSLSLSLAEAEHYLRELEQSQFSVLEKKIFAKFAEIKHLLRGISSELSDLKKTRVDTASGNKRLRKIAETTRRASINQLSRLSEKLFPPVSHDFSNLKDYCVSSHSLLQSEINHFGKNIAYTGLVLKEQMQTLGEKMNELNIVFVELNNLFKENLVLSGIPLMKEKLFELNSELLKRRNSFGFENQASLFVRGCNEKKLELNKEIEKLKNSSEANELRELLLEQKNLLDQKNNVRDKIFELMSGVEKPLRRFLQLAESGTFPLSIEEKDLLHSYLNNPFVAVKKDVKAEKLKVFLSNLKVLIVDGTIGFKEKEKQKRLKAVEKLLSFNFFDNVFWELNKVDTQLNDLVKRLDSFEINRKISQLEGELQRTEKQLEEKQSELLKIRASIEKSEQLLEEFKQKISEISSKHFNDEIVIQIK